MIFWYYHDKSQYQTTLHLSTPRPTLHPMISILIFRYYHDILILSWYIKMLIFEDWSDISKTFSSGNIKISYPLIKNDISWDYHNILQEMYDKIFDISTMIVLTDIVIFCNIEPHSITRRPSWGLWHRDGLWTFIENSLYSQKLTRILMFCFHFWGNVT